MDKIKKAALISLVLILTSCTSNHTKLFTEDKGIWSNNSITIDNTEMPFVPSPWKKPICTISENKKILCM